MPSSHPCPNCRAPMLSGDSHERYYFGDANKAVYDNGGYRWCSA